MALKVGRFEHFASPWPQSLNVTLPAVAAGKPRRVVDLGAEGGARRGVRRPASVSPS